MKNFNLLFSILLCFPLSTFAGLPDSIFDTAPFENPEYIGYRMAITDLSYSNNGNDKLQISYTLINTGRKDLLFGKNMSTPPYLVVNFDHTLASSGLYEYGPDIRDAITEGEFILKAGEISSPMRVKLNLDPAKQFIKPAEEIVELPDFMKQNSSAHDTDALISGALADGREAPANNKNNPADELTQKGFSEVDENACSDLIIESIRVIKKTKKQVKLEYTIVNQGPGPARIVNSQKKEERNMALKAHLSTKDKMTKGSLTFGGGFIPGGLSKRQGKLYPGEKYTNVISLNIQKMTDFTPYVILELDPYLSVSECDKTNNKAAVKVGKGRPDMH